MVLFFLISFKTFLLPRTSYVHDCWVWARDRHRFIMCHHPCLPSSLNEETFVTNKTHQEKREKVKLCVCLGNPSPLLPTNAAVHCENGKRERGHCFSRRRQARHRDQGRASCSHRNKNHHIRVLTGKTGGLAALWRHAFESNYTVAVQEAERIQHPNRLCQDQCCTVWFCY